MVIDVDAYVYSDLYFILYTYAYQDSDTYNNRDLQVHIQYRKYIVRNFQSGACACIQPGWNREFYAYHNQDKFADPHGYENGFVYIY